MFALGKSTTTDEEEHEPQAERVARREVEDDLLEQRDLADEAGGVAGEDRDLRAAAAAALAADRM